MRFSNNHVEKLLEKKVRECILSGPPHKPKEFRDAVLGANWQVAGTTVVKKDDGSFTVHFDRLPDDDRINLSFDTVGYGDGVAVALEVCWGKYSCSFSSNWSDFRPSLDGLEFLLHGFRSIAAFMEKKAPGLEKKMKEREDNALKQEKTRQIRHNTVKSWLTVLCRELEFPYFIKRLETRYDLYLQMPDETRAVFQIPVSNFEEVVAQTPALIRQFVDIYKNKKIKVLVLNPENRKHREIDWVTNEDE